MKRWGRGNESDDTAKSLALLFCGLGYVRACVRACTETGEAERGVFFQENTMGLWRVSHHEYTEHDNTKQACVRTKQPMNTKTIHAHIHTYK